MSTKTSETDPLPSPPFVRIDGLTNLRDIGGYEVPSWPWQNRSVRRGLVYRGGEPSRITTEGRAAFKALGVKKVFDIRTPQELGMVNGKPSDPQDKSPGQENEERFSFRRPVIELEGTQRIYLSAFGDEMVNEKGMTEEMKKEFEKFNKNTTEVGGH